MVHGFTFLPVKVQGRNHSRKISRYVVVPALLVPNLVVFKQSWIKFQKFHDALSSVGRGIQAALFFLVYFFSDL